MKFMRKYIWLLILLTLILVLMPTSINSSSTAIIYTSSSDGRINYSNSVYNTAWVSTTGTVYGSSAFTYMGQAYTGSNYIINKGFLYFDTSSINTGVTITSASIKLYGVDDYSDTNFNITVQTGTASTYPHDPMQSSDFDKSLYTGDGGTYDTSSGWSTSTYNTINLNATGISWINKGGLTKFCLRSDREIAGTTPTGSEFVVYYSQESAISKPYLSITYTPSTPSITAVTASNISLNAARLNSTITSDGGEVAGDTEVRFGYGTTTQAAVDFEDYDTVTAWVSGYSEDDNPYLDIASLSDTTTYFYRVQVKNSSATATSTNEVTFDTLTNVADMTDFNGIPNNTSIALYWTKSSGASKTMIRYATDTYPATTADGIQVYFDTSNTYTHTGLTAGTTYYYSAWGEDNTSYSTNAVNLVMTTSGADVTTISGGDTLDAPDFPSTWDQSPDYTKMANFQPFYGLINSWADAYGMNKNTMWVIVILLFISMVGFVTLIITRNWAVAMTLAAVIMLFATLSTMLPAYFIAVSIAMGIGGWAIQNAYG